MQDTRMAPWGLVVRTARASMAVVALAGMLHALPVAANSSEVAVAPAPLFAPDLRSAYYNDLGDEIDGSGALLHPSTSAAVADNYAAGWLGAMPRTSAVGPSSATLAALLAPNDPRHAVYTYDDGTMIVKEG